MNVLITQITQFFHMHDNALVFPLALSWLRCYPGDFFFFFFQNFVWILVSVTRQKMPWNTWIFLITSSTPATVLRSSLFRLALLRFNNLWANLDLESRQQLTHTHTYSRTQRPHLLRERRSLSIMLAALPQHSCRGWKGLWRRFWELSGVLLRDFSGHGNRNGAMGKRTFCW